MLHYYLNTGIAGGHFWFPSRPPQGEYHNKWITVFLLVESLACDLQVLSQWRTRMWRAMRQGMPPPFGMKPLGYGITDFNTLQGLFSFHEAVICVSQGSARWGFPVISAAKEWEVRIRDHRKTCWSVRTCSLSLTRSRWQWLIIRTTCTAENLSDHFKVRTGISGTCKIECIQNVLDFLWPITVYVYPFSAYLLTALAMSLKVSIICNIKCVTYLESHVMYTNTYKIHMYSCNFNITYF